MQELAKEPSVTTALYSVYGLTVESELPLLLPYGDTKSLPNIRLERGSDHLFESHRDKLLPPLPGEWGQHAILDDGSFYRRWDDWFEFIVSDDGRTIKYGRLGEGPLDAFEAYIANFAMCSALIQQGEEPLHATVVDLGGRAVGLLGDSGAGKSTLAAYLLQNGGHLVTDDMLRITIKNGAAYAEPGPLRLKLLEDPAKRYLENAKCRGRWNPLASKFLFEPGDPRAVRQASPLSALFWLGNSDDGPQSEKVQIDQLRGLEVFKTISASTMNCRVNTPKRLDRQLRFASRIGDILPVYRLAYKRRYDLLSGVAELLDQYSR